MTPSIGLKYTVSKDGTSYIVSGMGTCTDTDIIIPSMHEEKPVTAIEEYAFFNHHNITNITIPSSVTSISDAAFLWCTSIESVSISEGVTSIAEFAFASCKSLASIKIPSSMISIGKCAFADCEIIEQVFYEGTNKQWNKIRIDGGNERLINANILYNTVDGIDTQEEFDYSKGLEYILSEDETSYIVVGIGTCEETDIIIPSRYNGKPVTTIRNSAFVLCKEIVSVVIADGITSIGGAAFSGCASLKSITIPSSVTSIGDRTFYNCKSLTSIVIPSSVTTLGDRTFYHCTSLTSAIIPPSVIVMGHGVFNGCTSLTDITIGNGVTNIGSSAFSDCSNLTSITIPSNLTNIGERAFECTNITNVYYEGTSQQWRNIDIGSGNSVFDNAIITFKFTEVDVELEEDSDFSKGLKYALSDDRDSYIVMDVGTCSDKDVVIPSTYNRKPVVSIGDRAFDNCHTIKSITIPKSVTSIGFQSFISCENLTNVTFDEGIRTIGEQAFAFCTGLTEVTIPKRATRIGASAFSWCTNLSAISIPSSVKEIADEAFFDCKSLRRVYYAGGSFDWKSISIGNDNERLKYAKISYYHYKGE